MPLLSGIIRSSSTRSYDDRLQTLLAFGGVGGQLNAISFSAEQRFQTFANIGLVVDHQDAAARLLGLDHVGGEIRERVAHEPISLSDCATAPEGVETGC